jgi:hypothetical protein
MEIFTNTAKINRMAKIAKVLMYVGIGSFIGMMILFFTSSQAEKSSPDLLFFSIFYLVGFLAVIVLNIAKNLQMRYTAQTGQLRPDEQLDTAFKGLDGRYRLYHHYLPAMHVLVAPAGVYALSPVSQGGQLHWNNEKRNFEQQAGGFFGKFLRSESFGALHVEAGAQAEKLAKYLQPLLGSEAPPVQSLVVMLNPNVKMDDSIAQSPVPILRARELKAYVRKLGKGASLNDAQLTKLEDALKLAPAAQSSQA